MVSIYEMIPDPKGLLALEPEELAGVILEYLNSLAPDDRGQLNRHNFSLPHTYQQYPPESHRAIGRALMEAWVWLEREGLIAPDPKSEGNINAHRALAPLPRAPVPRPSRPQPRRPPPRWSRRHSSRPALLRCAEVYETVVGAGKFGIWTGAISVDYARAIASLKVRYPVPRWSRRRSARPRDLTGLPSSVLVLDQSRIACDNMFGAQRRRVDYRAIPRCVFTTPEVAAVGLTEQAARDKGIAVRVGRVDIRDNGRAITAGKTDGFVKVIADSAGRLLGGAVVAARGGEVARELALAISLNATASQCAEAIHAFPTYSEALVSACQAIEAPATNGGGLRPSRR